jgi:allantoate deiminase
LAHLRQFGKTPWDGVTRLPFTDEDRLAREYLIGAMQKADLKTNVDAVSSIVGRREGLNSNEGSIMIGSHYDTVINGGAYDGILGVVCGLEVLRVLQEHQIQLKKPVELIAFNDEEGVRFSRGFTGSKAIIGHVTDEDLWKTRDRAGVSLGQAMQQAGFDPSQIPHVQRKPEEISAYLELHIEQGPVLEAENIDIGIVTTIAGTWRTFVEIIGRPDHAGTTPMHMRKDPLVAAAQLVAKVPEFAHLVDPQGVATVGILNVEPNVANVVPAKVTFSLDIRSQFGGAARTVTQRVIEEARLICGDALECNIRMAMEEEPVHTDAKLQQAIEDATELNGYTGKRMFSGAGHDAQIMALLCPVGMIFVPSRSGRSHSHLEYTSPEAIAKGAQVLLDTVLKLAI